MSDAVAEIDAMAAAAPPEAAPPETAAHQAALRQLAAEAVKSWFDINFAASPVSANPAALGHLERALPALVDDLVLDPPVDYPTIFRKWLETGIFNSPLSRDVAALTHLTQRLPALAAQLASTQG